MRWPRGSRVRAGRSSRPGIARGWSRRFAPPTGWWCSRSRRWIGCSRSCARPFTPGPPATAPTPSASRRPRAPWGSRSRSGEIPSAPRAAIWSSGCASEPGRDRMPEGPVAEAVLAIRLRTLGDVVLVTPALRALKRGHPDAELEVVTERRYAPLLERLEGIDRVWTLERSTASTLALAGVLVRRRYRVAVDFFGNGRSAFLTLASRARLTAGYDLRGRRLAYRRTVPRTVAPAPGRREYAAATHLRLAAAVGGVP